MCIFKDNHLLWKEFSGEKGRQKKNIQGLLKSSNILIQDDGRGEGTCMKGSDALRKSC